MLTTYRRALELPGAWQFSASGFVARLPIAMIGLGIVLLISTRTGSYAMAGFLGGAFQISAAAGALVTSRWADQIGQRRVLPWLAVANALGLIGFVLAVEAGLPLAVQAVVIAFAGATQPAVGSMVRARWAHLAQDPDHLRSGFALESIIDELVFTIGPLLTAVLAFQLALPLPLIVAAVLGVIGALALAALHGTEPPAAQPRRAQADATGTAPHRRSALRLPGMVLMVVGAMGIGGVFGTYEVAVVAFAEEAGRSGASGIILGLWALGSMIGGIVFGSRRLSMPLPRQVMLVSLALSVVLVPAPFVRTIPLLAAATFVAGMMVAPALIAIFSLTERLVPPALLTEGLTWTNSGMAIGFSFGTSIGGWVVDAMGTSYAFVLPILCALMSFVTAALGQRTLSAASAGHSQPQPVVTWNTDPLPGPAPGGIVDDPTVNESRRDSA